MNENGNINVYQVKSEADENHFNTLYGAAERNNLMIEIVRWDGMDYNAEYCRTFATV